MSLRSRIARLPGVNTNAAWARRWRRVARLAASGLFDRRYWELQRDRRFGGNLPAIVDFVREGDRLGGSFHPLVDPAWVGSHHRVPGVHWVDALFLPGARVLSTSPVFDVVRAGRRGRASSSRLLRDFTRSAGPSTLLPVSERYAEGTRWGQVRERAYALAELVTTQRATAASREYMQWDREQERRAFEALPSTESLIGERVTVVMPALNRVDSIASSIRSIQAQTMTNWELIVIDDGSDDGTAEIVREFLADRRIQLIRQGRRGVSAARNAGISAARGTLIAFLDADNEWFPRHLEALVSALHASATALAYDAVQVHDDEGVHYLGGPGGYEQLRDGASFIDLNAVLVRRTVVEELDGFDESLRRWVDYDLMLRIVRRYPASFVPVLGVRYDHRRSRPDRISTSEARTWREVVLAPHLIDWERAAAGRRVRGRISVIMLGRRNWENTLGTVRNLLDCAADADLEILVVDNGGPASFSRLIDQAFGGSGRVTLIRLPREHGDSLKVDIALARGTGEYVLFFNHVGKVQDGWLDRLRAELESTDAIAVQPLLRRADGAVLHAGTLFLGDRQLPAPYLHGLALEDVERAGRRNATAVSVGAMLLRAEDAIRARGMSPALPLSLADADLCLRLAGSRPGGYRVLIEEVVTLHDPGSIVHPPPRAERARFDELRAGHYPPSEAEAYEVIGLRVTGRQESAAVELPYGPVSLERIDRGRVTRWAIKTAVPAASRGDDWGDRFFAEDLARALTRLGCVVSVDRKEANLRETAQLDDVVVALRGLAPLRPVPGAVNVLWIISHPDEVTGAELLEFDRVAAASESWARARAAMSDLEIDVLPQATDPALFRPGNRPREGTIFVGSTRGGQRPVVAAAIAAGLDVRIWGRGWERTPFANAVQGTSLERDDVAAAYSTAEFVVNDHWPDMARNGFLSNRLFDAAATGTRILSDPVEGIADMFGPLVSIVESPGDVLRAATDSVDEEVLLRIAATVARDHSFDRRAAQLIEISKRIRESRSGD